MDQIKLAFTFRDRYFSDLREQRIGGLAFLGRLLFVYISLFLLGVGVSAYISSKAALGDFPLYLQGLTALMTITLLSPILIVTIPVLIKKRSHDFNKDGKILTKIIVFSIIINALVSVVTIFKIDSSGVAQLLDYINLILFMVSLGIYIYLIGRLGTRGSNNYGEPIIYATLPSSPSQIESK